MRESILETGQPKPISDDGPQPHRFANKGIQHQHEKAARLIGRLRSSGFIVLPVPGNHDYGCMGTHTKKKYGRLFAKPKKTC